MYNLSMLQPPGVGCHHYTLPTACCAVRLSVCRQTQLPSVGLRELQGQTGDLHTAQLVFQTGLRVPSGMRPLRVDQHWTGYAFLPVVRGKAVCLCLTLTEGENLHTIDGLVFICIFSFRIAKDGAGVAGLWERFRGCPAMSTARLLDQ